MDEFATRRRPVLTALAAAGVLGLPGRAVAQEMAGETDPTTRATFRAIVDAVIPETPALAEELGPEHEPGGLAIGLDAYLITYVNTLFSLWDSPITEPSNARLAELVAKTCDAAAAELLARGGNDDAPDPTRFEGGGPFASLSRADRLRALALLDEKELDTARLPGPMAEGSAGIIPQLVVAFPQVIYYSEWEGYDDVTAPPSERSFEGDDLQSWRQTEFPGVIDGAVAFRGYWGRPDSSLGEGRVWRTVEVGGDGPPPQLTYGSGEFAENDYDTTGYDEPFRTDGEPASSFPDGAVDRFDDAVDAGREDTDDATLAALRRRIGDDTPDSTDGPSLGGGD